MIRPKVRCCLCAVVASLSTAGAARADARPLVTMAEVIHDRQGQVRDLSFAGDQLMASVVQDRAAPSVVIWRAGTPEPLAAGSSGAVSPDGRWLLYLDGQVWRLRNLASGESRSFAVDAPPSAYFGPPVWAPDSQTVAAHFDLPTGGLADPNPVRVEGGIRFEDRQPTAAATASAHLYNRPQLLIWSVAQPQPVLRELADTEAYAGSWKDAHTYLYAAGRHDYGGQTPYTVIRALDVRDGRERDLQSFPAFNQAVRPKVSPDSRWVALAIDLDTPRFGVANSIAALSLADGSLHRLTDGPAVSQVEWGADGRIYFTRRNGGLQPLMRVDLQGHLEQLTHDDLDHANLAASPARDALAYTAEDGQGRIVLQRRELRSGRETTVATLADPAAHLRLGRMQTIGWRSADGLGLRGFLFFPPDFDPTKTYPLFVDVHGSGPGAALSLHGGLFGWRGAGPLEWHAWAALGFVVFTPDYRSSGEYGRDVNLDRTAARDGDVTGIVQDARDVEAGVRQIMTLPYVDPSRMVLFGHSAGGGRANYLLTRTSMFAAAILHDPIGSGPDADVLSLAAKGRPANWTRATASPAAQDQLGADFLFDGWRSTTPTLIITGSPEHGALDPLSAETLYAMLLARHVPTRLLHYLDDGHVPATDALAEHQFAQMKAWLDRYVPRSAPARPAAPSAPSQ